MTSLLPHEDFEHLFGRFFICLIFKQNIKDIIFWLLALLHLQCDDAMTDFMYSDGFVSKSKDK
jgi:hypothetical protein